MGFWYVRCLLAISTLDSTAFGWLALFGTAALESTNDLVKQEVGLKIVLEHMMMGQI